MNNPNSSHLDLQAIARQVMIEHGFEPDFPARVQQQLATLKMAAPAPNGKVRDLRDLLWSSIDNDTSKDLDQIEVAEQLLNGDVRILVAIADVDFFVARDTAIDAYAAKETTTVYTGVRNFSMLPEVLSTGITSLLENQDAFAIVIDFIVNSDGHVTSSDPYRAIVRNRAQLTYKAIGPWLDGTGAAPSKITRSSSQIRAGCAISRARSRPGPYPGEANWPAPALRSET
jgi:exoribonuclease R